MWYKHSYRSFFRPFVMVKGHNLSGKPCGKIVALQHNQLRVGVEEGCSRMVQIAPALMGYCLSLVGKYFIPKETCPSVVFWNALPSLATIGNIFCHIVYAIFLVRAGYPLWAVQLWRGKCMDISTGIQDEDIVDVAEPVWGFVGY